jgi:hypothetical protein
MFAPKNKASLLFKSVSYVQIVTLLIFFILPAHVLDAQTINVLNLPVPGTLLSSSEHFVPLIVKGLQLNPSNPFEFDFIIDPGTVDLPQDQMKAESEKVIKYFLASLTVPEKDLWVNLSPYEHDRIIPTKLGETEMGRDLLAQDYILKQLSASLIYPEKDLGKSFWNRVYQKAKETYGTTDIPVNTFNKVWIIPESATILETKDTAFIAKSHLKVMLESDYEALDKNRANEVLGTDRLEDKDVAQVNSISSSIVKDIVLPEIEKEVNEGKNFAMLRQVYNSLLLAVWFKNNLKDHLINEVYSDKLKINGVDVADKTIKEQIYRQYLEAYRKGVFNYIKEDVDNGEAIPRKYFSGGEVFDETSKIVAKGEVKLDTPGAPTLAQAMAANQITEGDMGTERPEAGFVKVKTVVETPPNPAMTSNAAVDLGRRFAQIQMANFAAQRKNSNVPGMREKSAEAIQNIERDLAAIKAALPTFAPSVADKLIARFSTIATAEDVTKLTPAEFGLIQNMFRELATTQHAQESKAVATQREGAKGPADRALVSMNNARLFMPTIRFEKGKPVNREVIRQLVAKTGRTSEQVIDMMKKHLDAGNQLSMEAFLRGIDGAGSSIDLTKWQEILVKKGITNFDELPATTVIASAFKAKIHFELASNPDAIEYVAPAYGITADNPYIVTGEVKTDQDGRLPNRQLDAAAYIFRNLFGLKGIKIVMDEMPLIAKAGGMESSNAFNTFLVTAASALSGANLSFADITALAVFVENYELRGNTGGQGHWSSILGSAYKLRWVSGVKDENGQLVNNYGLIAEPTFSDEQLGQIENHVMLVQTGKKYSDDGKEFYETPMFKRAADLTNEIWTQMMEFDPRGSEIALREKALAYEYSDAMSKGDFERAGKINDEYVDLRDEMTLLGQNFIADYGEGKTDGMPAYAIELGRKVFDQSFSVGDYNANKPIRDEFERLKALGQLDQFRKNSLYTLGARGLIDEARKEGISLFGLGAGGPGANYMAISAKGVEHLKDFFQRQGLGDRPLTNADAQVIMTPAANPKGEVSVLKGYMEFKAGREPLKITGFDQLVDANGVRVSIPELEPTRTINGNEVGLKEDIVVTPAVSVEEARERLLTLMNSLSNATVSQMPNDIITGFKTMTADALTEKLGDIIQRVDRLNAPAGNGPAELPQSAEAKPFRELLAQMATRDRAMVAAISVEDARAQARTAITQLATFERRLIDSAASGLDRAEYEVLRTKLNSIIQILDTYHAPDDYEGDEPPASEVAAPFRAVLAQMSGDQAMKATEREVSVGASYFNGELANTKIQGTFTGLKKDQVDDITTMSPERRLQLRRLGAQSLIKGEGYLNLLQAGSASRQNPSLAPEDVKELVAGKPILSKAAVPVGVINGKPVTYMQAFGENIRRLFKALDREARQAGMESHVNNNKVGFFTNEEFHAEHEAILKENNGFGINAGIVFIDQPLGVKYYAKPDDVEKYFGKEEDQKFKDDTARDEFRAKKSFALNKAQERWDRFKAGDHEAVVLENEREALGHGEVLHQMIASGLILDLWDSGIKWASIRNIDNYSGTYDDTFLEIVGLFIEKGLDFQFELSPRAPGQKGGGPIRLNGRDAVAEDAILKASGAKTTDSDWINNAAGIASLRYIINPYKKDGQTDNDFIAELRAARDGGNKDAMEAITDRGRQKFYTLLDAKPAKSAEHVGVISMKRETNTWTSSLIASPEMRIAGIGTGGITTFPIVEYKTSMNAEQKLAALKTLRFMATKQWDVPDAKRAEVKAELEKNRGRAVDEMEVDVVLESFKGNKWLSDDMLDFIFNGPIFTSGTLTNADVSGAVQMETVGNVVLNSNVTVNGSVYIANLSTDPLVFEVIPSLPKENGRVFLKDKVIIKDETGNVTVSDFNEQSFEAYKEARSKADRAIIASTVPPVIQSYRAPFESLRQTTGEIETGRNRNPEYGGIDLNPANLTIELDKQNGGMDVHYDPAVVEQLRQHGVDGLVPFIIDMEPMPSVMPLLSGVAPQERAVELTKV